MDATVSTLITQFSNGEANGGSTQSQQFYIDALDMLGTIPVLVSLPQTVTPSSGLVSFPTSPLAINVLLVFHAQVQCGELSVREANWLAPMWRTATGAQAYNFVVESISSRAIQLVPVPSPAGSAQLIVTYYTDTLPVWLQLPVALLVLEMEYKRESDHQNLELANAYGAVARFLLHILTK